LLFLLSNTSKMVEIKKALELKQELDTLRPINTEQEQRIMQKFRLDWNYHSNHLEGNSLTYGETKALLLFGVTAQGKPLKDTLEITGHNEALNWVIDVVKKDYPLTENFIRELHSLLLKDSYKESINEDGKIVSRRISAGKYKSNPNHVLTATGEIFYFATPEETPAKMYDLLNWYKEKIEDKDVNPILIAAEFHYKFIRIHPFDDGNGRTARILMNFILMQFGFPPVIIKTQDKENYFAVLRLADAGNLEAFVTYIAENLNVSLEIMIAGAKGENIEEDDDLDKEIALLEQRLKIVDNKLENKIENLSISLIDLIDSFYLSQSKFKKLYKFYDFKFYINDELFDFDRNKILNYFSDSLSKKKVYLEIYLIYNFSSFFEWENNDVNYSVNLEIEFKQNNYSIAINQEVILEKEQLQPIDKNDISIIISKLNIVHKEFIEQKIAEKENK
jgi:Fic family protein